MWVPARMISNVPRFSYITENMSYVLRWLPVQQRFHYKISIVWHYVLGNATSACSGRRFLRSASRDDFMAPLTRTDTVDKWAFSIVDPSVWNSFPSVLCSLPQYLSSSVYGFFKTFIFDRAWTGRTSEYLLLRGTIQV